MPKKNLCCSFKKHKKNKKNANKTSDDEEFEDILDFKDLKPTNSHVLFNHHLTSALECGSYVNIQGNIHSSCLRFAVDFVCGPRSVYNSQIAFHFNPRLDSGYIVRNSMVNGSWDTEETTSSTKCRLVAGKPFQLNFFVTQMQFMVLINGYYFCSFCHRVRPEVITAIEITGDVTVKDLKVYKESVFPPLNSIATKTVYFDVNYSEKSNENYELPYFGRLENKLYVGCQLEVYGRVKLLPHMFFVNIQRDCQLWPHPKIPLHLNPRFSGAIGANSFIRNSWSDGGWMREERAPSFPFQPGHAFLLVVRIEDFGYSVWVNNMLTGEFPYRVRLEDVKEEVIHIEGDIYLDHVTVRTHISNTEFSRGYESLTQL